MLETETPKREESPPGGSPHGECFPRRVIVVGSTGSGKTTLAAYLARRMSVPHIELDALHWAPNWTEVPDELLRERVEAASAGDGWVADGNYNAVRDILWPRAELVVWLDYTLPRILWRLTVRTFFRVARREELWHGNRESVRTWLFSRDSLYLWALQTYGKRRKDYPIEFAKPQHSHLKVLHFHTPRATNAWLRTLIIKM